MIEIKIQKIQQIYTNNIDLYQTFHYQQVVKRLGRKRLRRKRLSSETSVYRMSFTINLTDAVLTKIHVL